MIRTMLARGATELLDDVSEASTRTSCVMYIQNSFTKDIMPVVSVVFHSSLLLKLLL